MNYFEIEKYQSKFLENNFHISNYPIINSLTRAHLKREIINKNLGAPYNPPNMLLSNFAYYTNITNFAYIARLILFTFQRTRKTNISPNSILLSPYMCTRFPDLVDRLKDKSDIIFFITALNFRFSKDQSPNNKVSIHSKIYTRNIIKLLKSYFTFIKNDFVDEIPLRYLNSEYFKHIENELYTIVQNTSEIMKKNNVTQFISSYDNRYDDIIIAYACKVLNIPSKELAHGVNNFTLQSGQTMVPTTFDYLLVWKAQMKKGIDEYGGDKNRIKVIGYPKYTKKLAKELQSKYPQEKIITYFSQPIYDIQETPNYKITNHVIELERNFRVQIIKTLDEISKITGYKVQIRYHNGEKNNPSCPREKEITYIKSLPNVTISQNSFHEDMFKSEICLGINSSCLYEAKVLSKKVMQLRFPLNKFCYHDDILVVEGKECDNEIKNLINSNTCTSEDSLYINDNKLIQIGI